MKNPLVTVGIPFYNAQETLLDTIRSIFAQTYDNWELILVDDGSTDNSLDIAFSIDDPRVRVLPPDGRNRRLPARLNQITDAARGDYIARIDADDLSHPQRLQKQLEFLKAHPDIDVVGSCACVLDEQRQPAYKLIRPAKHEAIFKDKFKSGVPIIHPSVMAKTHWFRCWPYNEKNIRCEDYELWLTSCNDSIFSNMPDLLCFKDEFVSFSLSNYAKSKHTGAKLYWRYARSEIGFLRTVCRIVTRYLQVVTYAGAKFLNQHNKMITQRYQLLTPQELADANAALDIISKTRIPIRSTE